MKYKGIVHNVLNDAPFIGALIIANQCSRGCVGCHNSHLKSSAYTLQNTAEEIIRRVKANGLNKGVILSGLEWTEQPHDLVELTRAARAAGLEVIVYTHHEEPDFFSRAPELKGEAVYIKFGAYDAQSVCDTHYSYGVKLATKNQYIRCFK